MFSEGRERSHWEQIGQQTAELSTIRIKYTVYMIYMPGVVLVSLLLTLDIFHTLF